MGDGVWVFGSRFTHALDATPSPSHISRGGGALSLSAHQSAAMKHDEWLTPPEILRPLGAFDLDPCAPIMRPWDTAAKHLNVNDDGLSQPWHGRVWCNPPFGV